MAQPKPPGEGWELLAPPPKPPGVGWEPVDTTPEPAKQSWGDWFTEIGFGAGPAVLSDLVAPAVGAAFPPAAPITVPATRFLGGALGEIGRQIYADDEPFNWGLIGTEGGLNLLNIFGPAGKGLMSTVKQGAKEGAAQGFLGSFPRHVARTDQWELPSVGEVAGETVGGAGFGGLVGGVYHGAQTALNRPKPIAPLPPDLYQQTLPMAQPPHPGPTAPPPQINLPGMQPGEGGLAPKPWFGQDAQLDYNLQAPPPDARTTGQLPFDTIPPEPPPTGPQFPTAPLGPFGFGGGPLVPPSGSPAAPPPRTGAPPAATNLPPVISAKGFLNADIAYWTSKGYRPGGRGPDGYAQMVRGDTPPPTAPQPPPPAPPPPPQAPPRPGAGAAAAGPMGQGQIPLGDTLRIPRPELDDKLSASLAQEGYVVTNPDENGNVVLERRGPAPPMAEELRIPPRSAPEFPTQAVPGVDLPRMGQQGMGGPVGEGQLSMPFDPRYPMDLGPTPSMEDFAAPTGQLGLPFGRERRGYAGGEIPPDTADSRYPRTPPDALHDAAVHRDKLGVIARSQTPERARAIVEQQEELLRTVIERTPERRLAIQQARELYDAANARLDQLMGGGPEEMRVPGVRGRSGLENVALGGASPRVWDVAATSLYSGRRPVIAGKELLQNAFDEHRTAGVTAPVRMVINNYGKNPRTNTQSKTVTVRDNGRGMTPEQIYTKLTDLGETGKAEDPTASGGFGFAKAAPFGGGKHVEVISTVQEGRKRIQYSFDGTFAELKNQAQGVEIRRKVVDSDIPTGLEVTVHFDPNDSIWGVEDFVTNLVENSPSLTSDLLLLKGYNSQSSIREFLDSTIDSDISTPETGIIVESTRIKRPETVPQLRDVIRTPGADISIRYDEPELGAERTGYNLNLLNKGLYQSTESGGYGMSPLTNVPRSIVADIVATVEEGTTGYPFTANREQIDSDVSDAIRRWIRENIISGAERKRVEALQKYYDEIAPLEGSESPIHFYDEGNRFTPEEIDQIRNSRAYHVATNAVEAVHRKMMEVADTLGWERVPSERLKKFGMLFKGPDTSGTTMGIHIPRADDLNDSAILINLMEHLNEALKEDDPLDAVSAKLFATMAHEIAHVPGGGHDKGHSYRDADLRGKFGGRKTKQLLDILTDGLGDLRGGQINSELSELLQVYNRSRARASSTSDALLATGTSRQRSSNTRGGTPKNVGGVSQGQAGPRSVMRNAIRDYFVSGDEKEASKFEKTIGLSTAITTTLDLSAAMRQGLPFLLNRQWRGAFKEMWKVAFSKNSDAVAKAIDADIRSKPIFQRRVNLLTKKVEPSFAEKIGLKLIEGSQVSKSESDIAGDWVEHIPGFGRFAKRSNNAYATFLNHLRANTLEKLLNDSRAMAMEGVKTGKGLAQSGVKGWLGMSEAMGEEAAANLNAYNNIPLAKEIADFVNTATGRGPLRFHAVPVKGTEIDLEGAAKLFKYTLFSPRLVASRMRMMNPNTYAMANPYVRKQYLKAALATASAWAAISGLAKIGGADVSDDPNSADFGKIKIGNTRLDPGGGFQQFFVAYSRMLSGKYTSSATEQEHELGAGYQATTRKDIAERFMANKLNPIAKFAWDLFDASQYQPFHVADRTAQMYVPLVVQDIIELAKEDPNLIPAIMPWVMLGMGTQTYGSDPQSYRREQEQGKLWPKSWPEFKFEGGSAANVPPSSDSIWGPSPFGPSPF